jgi:ferritin-like protein
MKKEEVKNLIEKVINEKIQLILNRIDTFQSNVFKNIEKLKDFDDLVEFTMPDDSADQNDGLK